MDIADRLRRLGLEKYAPAFDENAINWEVLSELTIDDLKDIGVAAVGDRQRLLAAISALGECCRLRRRRDGRPLRPSQ
ncbi:MAG TPA: SAM domain-containing protein [Stellaceae bacterium]